MTKKTKKSVSKTKKVHRKTVGFPAKVVKEIQTIMGKRNGKKVSLKEIRAMILYLFDNYTGVSYKKNILTIQTDDIYARGHNYGPFVLRLNLKSIGGKDCHYYMLTLTPVGNRHVYSSGRLCFGNGYNVCEKCANDGRLDDFVDIVQQILRT